MVSMKDKPYPLYIVCDAGWRNTRTKKKFWARVVIEIAGPRTVRAYYPFDQPNPENALRIEVPELEWRRLMQHYGLTRVRSLTAKEKTERKRVRQQRWRERKRQREKRELARQRVPFFVVQQIRNRFIRGTPSQMKEKIKTLYGITLHRSTVKYYKDKKRRYIDRRMKSWTDLT